MLSVTQWPNWLKRIKYDWSTNWSLGRPLSVCLFVCLSLSACLCLSLSISIYLYIYLYIYICLSPSSISLSISLTLSLSLPLPCSSSPCPSLLSLAFSLSRSCTRWRSRSRPRSHSSAISISIYIYIYMSLNIFLYLYIYLYISLIFLVSPMMRRPLSLSPYSISISLFHLHIYIYVSVSICLSLSLSLSKYIYIYIIQIKICAEYQDMLPRPRLICQEHGLRPIGLSPGVPDKSRRGLGSMSRYSAQILICFITYVFLFLFTPLWVSLGIVQDCHHAECPLTLSIVIRMRLAIRQSKLPACLAAGGGAAGLENTIWHLCPRTGEIDRWNMYQWEVFSTRTRWMESFCIPVSNFYCILA